MIFMNMCKILNGVLACTMALSMVTVVSAHEFQEDITQKQDVLMMLNEDTNTEVQVINGQ